MSASVRAGLIALWLLAVGLVAVHLEVENVRGGARTRDLLLERDSQMEKLRRLEMRYNRLVSPDLLEKGLPPEMKDEPPVFGPRVGFKGGRQDP